MALVTVRIVFTYMVLALACWTKYAASFDGPIFHGAVSWFEALRTCSRRGRLLQPEGLGGNLTEYFSSANFSFPTGEYVWLNAKIVTKTIGSTQVFLKLAFLPAGTRLEYCICENKTRTKRVRVENGDTKSWKSARHACKNNQMALYTPRDPGETLGVVNLLGMDRPFWIQNTSLTAEDESSTENASTAQCLILKMEETGRHSLYADNCDSKHGFVCVEDPGEYAPAVTRLSVSVPKLQFTTPKMGGPPKPQDYTDQRTGMIVGSSIGGAVVVVIVTVFTCRYLRHFREQRKQRRYVERLDRYIQGQRTLTATVNRSREPTQAEQVTVEIPHQACADMEDYRGTYMSLKKECMDSCTVKPGTHAPGTSEAGTSNGNEEALFVGMPGYLTMEDVIRERMGREDHVPVSYERYDPASGEVSVRDERVTFLAGPCPDFYENTRQVMFGCPPDDLENNQTSDPTEQTYNKYGFVWRTAEVNESPSVKDAAHKANSLKLPKASEEKQTHPSLVNKQQNPNDDNYNLPPRRARGKYGAKIPLKPPSEKRIYATRQKTHEQGFHGDKIKQCDNTINEIADCDPAKDVDDSEQGSSQGQNTGELDNRTKAVQQDESEENAYEIVGGDTNHNAVELKEDVLNVSMTESGKDRTKNIPHMTPFKPYQLKTGNDVIPNSVDRLLSELTKLQKKNDVERSDELESGVLLSRNNVLDLRSENNGCLRHTCDTLDDTALAHDSYDSQYARRSPESNEHGSSPNELHGLPCYEDYESEASKNSVVDQTGRSPLSNIDDLPYYEVV